MCSRNVPVAELRAIPQAAKNPRPVGLAKGKFPKGKFLVPPNPAALRQAQGETKRFVQGRGLGGRELRYPAGQPGLGNGHQIVGVGHALGW
jgi:hypothetical protein